MRNWILAVLTLGIATPAWAWQLENQQGEVQLMHGKAKAAKGAEHEELKEGDQVTTGKDGKALLKDGESEIWIAPKSSVTLAKIADMEKEILGRLDVNKGQVRAKFKRPAGPEEFPYQIKAKTVIASVRGTVFFVAVDGSEERVATLEGSVRVSTVKSSGEGWDVPAGRGVFVRPGEMPRVRELTEAQKKTWLQATTL